MGADRRQEAAAPGSPSAADAGGSQGALLEAERGNDGQREGQHSALVTDLLAKLSTARACAHVAAKDPSPQFTGACGGKLLANLGAGHVTGATILDQCRAGLEDERLHLLRLAAERLGYLVVSEVADLR